MSGQFDKFRADCALVERFVDVLVLAIWGVSLASAWPLFSMFKTKQVADSVGFYTSPYHLTNSLNLPNLVQIYDSSEFF